MFIYRGYPFKMGEQKADSAEAVLDRPVLWGFVSTFLFGVFGLMAALLGAWPMLWLPLLSPLFAFFFMRTRFHNNVGFDRFLAGFGACLVVFIVLGILFFTFVV